MPARATARFPAAQPYQNVTRGSAKSVDVVAHVTAHPSAEIRIDVYKKFTRAPAAHSRRLLLALCEISNPTIC